MLYYSSANKEISEKDIVRKIQELDGKGGEIMTVLERREEKGREEERSEIVKGLIKEGAETELIAKVTKMSREKVEEIRKGMDTK